MAMTFRICETDPNKTMIRVPNGQYSLLKSCGEIAEDFLVATVLTVLLQPYRT